MKTYAKSTNALITNTRLQLDDSQILSVREEQLNLELGKNSQFELDESNLFYRKKKTIEVTESQMKPFRFNTCNVINSSGDHLCKENEFNISRRVTISCKKVIFEYEKSGSEDESSTNMPSSSFHLEDQK